jgi:hypothetical protein
MSFQWVNVILRSPFPELSFPIPRVPLFPFPRSSVPNPPFEVPWGSSVKRSQFPVRGDSLP